MIIERACPMCGKRNTIKVDKKAYYAYVSKTDLIQNLFPELNPMEREFVISGYCSECQGLLFRTDYTSDKISERA